MTSNPSQKPASWSMIAMLAAAQFIMALDTTVMDVSAGSELPANLAFAESIG